MQFRDFQQQTAKILEEGNSVLLHAPTGLGKTWATAKGFVDNLQGESRDPLIGTRLLHVLPMRALANSVAEDLQQLLSAHGFSFVPTIHHGQQQESEIYAERVGVTTIDQYLAGFAGAPLSFSSKSGHALAGAIVGSYSVFDEVHLLGPERGLPLLYALLKQRQSWGLRSAVMTATLPDGVRQFLHDQVGLQVVELSESDIQTRDSWRKVQLEFKPTALKAQDVVQQLLAAQEEHQRVICFVNTVDAALELYAELAARQAQGLLLAHSNFAPSHRKAIEQKLLQTFGRDSTQSAILITTQVAEAGINISAPVVFSELAPIDSLVQRAGRCARFKPTHGSAQGRLVVYKPQRDNSHVPYDQGLVLRTEVALEQKGSDYGLSLDWPTECSLVNTVLNDFYLHFMVAERVKKSETQVGSGKKRTLPKISERNAKALSVSDALGIIDQTFFSRNPSTLEYTLREINNVQIIVASDVGATTIVGHSDDSFSNYLDRQNQKPLWQRDTLESVPVSFGRFLRQASTLVASGQIKELVSEASDNNRVMFALKDVDRVLPNHTYVLSQAVAGYNTQQGLTFSSEINDASTTPLVPSNWQPSSKEHHFQSWYTHCQEVFLKASAMLEHYQPFITHYAQQLAAQHVIKEPQMFSQLVVLMIRMGALFHDVGKLSLAWQRAIGWSETAGEFWGKSNDDIKRKLPPHAFHALPVLLHLYHTLGLPKHGNRMDRLAEIMAMAAARHHSLGNPDGTMNWPTFEQHPQTLEAIHTLLEGCDAADLKAFVDQSALDAIHSYPSHSENGNTVYSHTIDAPKPSDAYYPLYVLACRIIKVGDWEASGKKEVELCR